MLTLLQLGAALLQLSALRQLVCIISNSASSFLVDKRPFQKNSTPSVLQVWKLGVIEPLHRCSAFPLVIILGVGELDILNVRRISSPVCRVPRVAAT